MTSSGVAPFVVDFDKLSSSRILVLASGIELENVDKLTKRFWQYLNRYLHEQCLIIPDSNDCSTLYFDTAKFDVFRSGLTLRDRPGGGPFDDQFSAKSRHPEYTEYAEQLTRSLYPRQDMTGFMPYIRTEIESSHSHPRDVSEYRYFDFPPDIQIILEDRIGSRCKDMVYKPQVISYVERNRYSVLLDPKNAFDFIMPMSVRDDEQSRNDNYVCVEVAMDKCVHRRPTPGLPISDILLVAPAASGQFSFLKADWLAEREFKPGLSGAGLTDEMMASAYIRFGMFFHDLSVPFRKKGQEPPIRPVRSKAARGLDALLTKYPRLAPPDFANILGIIP